MFRPDRAPAELRDAASPLAHGATLGAFVLASAAAAVLASLSLLQGIAAPAPRALLVGLTALMVCAATAAAWALWRQRALGAALRNARLEARAWAELIDGLHWRSDSAHRLTLLRAPPGAGDAPCAGSAAIGKPVWEYFGADNAAAATLRARLENGADLGGLRVWRQDGNGARQQLELRGGALLDVYGRSTGYLGSARMIDDEHAPRAAGAAHESFGYTVSHDLRAPIRVVEGFTRMLKEDYGEQLDPVGNDHLDRVLGAAARMNSMIDALLALSQLSSRPLSRQPVDLSQLATFVVEDLRRQSPERAVDVHIAVGLQTHGDPTLLRMVLENLLGNAWKYSSKKPAAQIWFERTLQEGRPVFSVRDNGAGFDMRFADRLFGVFQRLHGANDFPGTGVGLASVRRIVSRHGGEVWAEAVVDRGSCFHFTLPARDAAP